VQLDHSSKNQWINIPSISETINGGSFVPKSGPTVGGRGNPIQLQLSAQNGGVGKQKKCVTSILDSSELREKKFIWKTKTFYCLFIFLFSDRLTWS